MHTIKIKYVTRQYHIRQIRLLGTAAHIINQIDIQIRHAYTCSSLKSHSMMRWKADYFLIGEGAVINSKLINTAFKIVAVVSAELRL